MALYSCHECNAQISTEAKTCPHCGAKAHPPPKPARNIGKGEVALYVILVLGAAGWIASTNSNSEEGRAAAAAKTAACTKNLKCWGERNWSEAEARCPKAVERLATHSVRWRDGLKFTKYRWMLGVPGAVTYIGDSADFQNGFGAYTAVVYECDFDPDTNAVLDVRASEGRLP